MDFHHHKASQWACRFLRHYLLLSDDYSLLDVLELFVFAKALVRAKIALFVANQLAEQPSPSSTSQQRQSQKLASIPDYLSIGKDALTLRQAKGDVVMMTGTVATGKSSAAHEVANITGAVTVASDCVRKALFDISSTDHSQSAAVGEGIYSAKTTAQVYEEILKRALYVVNSGRLVVLDATYGKVNHREGVVSWCKDNHVNLAVVRSSLASNQNVLPLLPRPDVTSQTYSHTHTLGVALLCLACVSICTVFPLDGETRISSRYHPMQTQDGIHTPRHTPSAAIPHQSTTKLDGNALGQVRVT